MWDTAPLVAASRVVGGLSSGMPEYPKLVSSAEGAEEARVLTTGWWDESSLVTPPAITISQ